MDRTTHMPQLDIILMVENAIKQAKVYPSKINSGEAYQSKFNIRLLARY